MNLMAGWLVNIAMQSALLLIAACVIDRLFTMRTAWRELLWRAALFGGVITASLQLVSSQAPLAGRWRWPESTVAANVAPPALTSAIAPTATTSSPKPSSKPQPATSDAPAPAMRSWLPPLRWLVGLWVIGAFLLSLRGIVRWMRLRDAFADAVALDDESLARDTAAISERAGIAAPTLYVMDALPSPVALHDGRVVLPEWAVASLDSAHLRAMIAHETAHIARRDPAWKAFVAAWRSIFWFVPSGFVLRRLDDLAELACDAFAAESIGNPRGLAECLAFCAEHHAGLRALDLVPAMAARKSSLMFRIDRLLEGATMETGTTGNVARVIALITLAAAVVALPAIGIESGMAHAAPASAADQGPISATHAGNSKSSISVHSDDDGDDSAVISVSDDRRSFTANIHGKLVLNDDETEIVGLSEGGTAKLSVSADGMKQRLELAERGGKLERHYYVDNTEHAYDDPARAFMVTVSTDMARSGIDAEGRAKRLYAKGGAPRVFDEIAKVHSDYVSGIYLRTLADIDKLTPSELDRAIVLAGGFDSDYERRQSLTHLFETQPFDAPHQIAYLHQVEKFGSDYDHAEMLVGIIPHLVDSPDVRQAWFDAARGLKSDYDRRRTYEAMLAHHGASDQQIAAIIAASTTMHSDYDRGELLKLAAKRAHDGDAIAADYAKSVDGIGSDYNRREALGALMETDHFGARAAGAVLDAAARVTSSYDRTQLLISLARVMPSDAALVERYRDIASHLPANERGEAESALMR